MNEKKSKIVLLVGYCIPYIFLCMYGDAVWGTGLVYGFAAIAMGLLCVLACKTQNIKFVVIGNIISFAVSESCIVLFAMEKLNYYFKPFSVHKMACVCTVIAILIQAYLISRLTDDSRRHKDIVEDRKKARTIGRIFGK